MYDRDINLEDVKILDIELYENDRNDGGYKIHMYVLQGCVG